MKRSGIVAAFYVAFLANSLLSLFFGSSGVTATASNRTRTELLLKNVDNLDERQLQLVAKLEMLRSDPESVIIEARALGFYRHDEKVMHIQNLETPRSMLETGRALYMKSAEPERHNSHKTIAIMAGLLVLFLSLTSRNLRNAHSAK